MRNFYNKGGPTLTKAQQTLPDALKKKILMAKKNKKKKPGETSPMAKLGKESIMAKLCAKGKAAAKRKFKVYPSAYANMYGSAVCSGKVTPGGKKKKKKSC